MGFSNNKSSILAAIVAISLVILVVLFLNYDNLLKSQDDKVENNGDIEVSQPEKKVELTYEEMRSFVHDSTFFDNADDYTVEDLKTRISLEIVSIEKDMRVKIVDMMGELASGESFTVEVNERDIYKDIDRDGIIYIGNLKPGEYSVKLEAKEGYNVENTKTYITVKERLEYTAIDDISYLLLSENDVDAKVEDSEEKSAIVDGDKSQDINPKLSDEGYSFGIDVSKFQGNIDWQKVADAGVDFAIIRLGYRGSESGALVEDSFFLENINGASEAGIKVGLYFFTQAINEVEAVEEASVVLSLARRYDIEYPIFIDTESAGGNGRADGLDKATRTAVCDAFCKTIENDGYIPGIYASKNWYNDRIEYDDLKQYTIWLAQYTKEPTFDENYHIWQYTSKGKIDGISGNVDLNISFLK